MILTPTCHLLKRGDSYLLALNESGNDAAQLSAADLARLLQMAADFQMLDQQFNQRLNAPTPAASSQPRSGGDSAESSPVDAYLRQKTYVELGILPHPFTGGIL